MKTDPIRWICGTCFKVERRPLESHFSCDQNGISNVRICLPHCCGQDMLLAGWIDLVDNLIKAQDMS